MAEEQEEEDDVATAVPQPQHSYVSSGYISCAGECMSDDIMKTNLLPIMGP